MAGKSHYRARVRNILIKTFFRTAKFLVYRPDYRPSLYRKAMDRMTWFLPMPPKVKITRDKVGEMEAAWIRPENSNADSVILYLHGGAYGMGSIASHKALASRIARSCRSQSLLVDYRLAPEHPFPCAVEDSVNAYKWLLQKGFSPSKIVIGGDSAGGGLTLATLQKLKDENLPQPLAAFGLSPWLDLAASCPEIVTHAKNDPFIRIADLGNWAQKYAGEALTDPLASPYYADLQGTCPLLIQVGTSEVLLFENRRFYERLVQQGHDIQFEEYKNMVHVFQVFGGFLPQADRAIDSIGRFVFSKVKATGAAPLRQPLSS